MTSLTAKNALKITNALHVVDKKSLHQMESSAFYAKLKTVINVLLLSLVLHVLEIILFYPKTEPSVFLVLMEKSHHKIDKLVLLVK